MMTDVLLACVRVCACMYGASMYHNTSVPWATAGLPEHCSRVFRHVYTDMIFV
jgi:hypothetical protein